MINRRGSYEQFTTRLYELLDMGREDRHLIYHRGVSGRLPYIEIVLLPVLSVKSTTMAVKSPMAKKAGAKKSKAKKLTPKKKVSKKGKKK